MPAPNLTFGPARRFRPKSTPTPFGYSFSEPMEYEEINEERVMDKIKEAHDILDKAGVYRPDETHPQLAARLRMLIGQRDALATEVDRLQAIVDKLPKCWRLNDAGELVQDCPVIPGMVVYRRDSFQPQIIQKYDTHVCTMTLGDVTRHEYYNTPEAAKAGKET